MTSLYVDRRGVTLKADGEALVFYENGERVGTVPLAPLSRVFLRGDVTLSSSLLGKLGERGIGVVVLSGRKAEPTLLLGRPHNDAARRMTQYRLSLDTDFCLRFARGVVEGKLRAQADFLAERRDDEPLSRYRHYRFRLPSAIRPHKVPPSRCKGWRSLTRPRVEDFEVATGGV